MISGAASMCMHYIDDLLPHAPLRYAATGDMVVFPFPSFAC